MVTHRWWSNKFCKRACKDAYLHEVALGRDKIRRPHGFLQGGWFQSFWSGHPIAQWKRRFFFFLRIARQAQGTPEALNRSCTKRKLRQRSWGPSAQFLDGCPFCTHLRQKIGASVTS
jgi:hypothetical protein